jgi:hypothetical protein
MTPTRRLIRSALLFAAGASAAVLSACSISYTGAETPDPTAPAPVVTTTTTTEAPPAVTEGA